MDRTCTKYVLWPSEIIQEIKKMRSEKPLNIWKLINTTCATNNSWIEEESINKTKNTPNENQNTGYQHLWDEARQCLEGK